MGKCIPLIEVNRHHPLRKEIKMTNNSDRCESTASGCSRRAVRYEIDGDLRSVLTAIAPNADDFMDIMAHIRASKERI